MSAAAHGRRARKIEKMRSQTLQSITNSRYQTIAIPLYKGDNTLRQSSINYIQLCYNVFNEDYARIVNMEEIAEQSFDQMQAYLLMQEKTSEKIQEASDKMDQAEKDFAVKYNINLIESKSELGSKMEVASKLNHYTDQIFLLFFKCNWEDGEMTKAMNNKKVTAAEQARNALIKYTEDGLQALTLDTLKAFMGDPSLAAACRQALQFYKKTAEKDIPKLTDFFLKEENFEKIKKTMDSKSDKSKEDVDTYNKAVKEINEVGNAFNQTNNTINNNRSQVLQNWENAEKSFADTHMPYYKG
jgi:hypothetical protein